MMNASDSRFEPIDAQFRPITIEEIRELEQKVHSSLPTEFVDFLSRHGGCGFSGDAKVVCHGQSLPIFTFFDNQKLLSKLEVYSDLAVEGRIGIADDLFGNPFVLDVSTGKVYFIDFTTNPPVGKKVADSFSKFLASIEVQPFE